MPVIEIDTLINASIQKCFDLSRSIDLHVHSMKHTNEVAITGVTSGLIHLNETVTWKAKHFGLFFTMTIKITAIQAPDYFVDEQVKGPFKKLKHTHQFRLENRHTLMTDIAKSDCIDPVSPVLMLSSPKIALQQVSYGFYLTVFGG